MFPPYSIDAYTTNSSGPYLNLVLLVGDSQNAPVKNLNADQVYLCDAETGEPYIIHGLLGLEESIEHKNHLWEGFYYMGISRNDGQSITLDERRVPAIALVIVDDQSGDIVYGRALILTTYPRSYDTNLGEGDDYTHRR